MIEVPLEFGPERVPRSALWRATILPLFGCFFALNVWALALNRHPVLRSPFQSYTRPTVCFVLQASTSSVNRGEWSDTLRAVNRHRSDGDIVLLSSYGRTPPSRHIVQANCDQRKWHCRHRHYDKSTLRSVHAVWRAELKACAREHIVVVNEDCRMRSSIEPALNESAWFHDWLEPIQTTYALSAELQQWLDSSTRVKRVGFGCGTLLTKEAALCAFHENTIEALERNSDTSILPFEQRAALQLVLCGVAPKFVYSLVSLDKGRKGVAPFLLLNKT